MEDGNFWFSSEDIATLSGGGSSSEWKIENGKAVEVPNTGTIWMS